MIEKETCLEGRGEMMETTPTPALSHIRCPGSSNQATHSRQWEEEGFTLLTLFSYTLPDKHDIPLL